MPENAVDQLQRDVILVRRAFDAAQGLRPYRPNSGLCAELTPPGGFWTVVLAPDNSKYELLWYHQVFAEVRLRPLAAAGDIAMAFRCAPTMDAALRTILAIAKSPLSGETDGIELIARIAEAVIARIEEPAPRPQQTETEEGEDDEQG